MRERMLWIAGGLVGLLLAGALALVTSGLTQPPVGLADEPVSAGQALAPLEASRTATSTAPVRRTTTPAPSRTATTDDHGGDSDDDGGGDDRGRGRGRGGDDADDD